MKVGGFSIAYDVIFLIFIIRELFYPLHEQTADFTCSCSWASSVAVMGLYASSVVGLSVFPSDADRIDIQTCLPEKLAVTILAFTLSSAVYTIILVGAAVIRANIRFILPTPTALQQPQQPQQEREGRPRGLSADQTATIHVIQVTENAPLSNPNPTPNTNPCAICLLECVGSVKRLNCGHQYHAECIDTWLQRQNACALCRRPAVILPT